MWLVVTNRALRYSAAFVRNSTVLIDFELNFLYGKLGIKCDFLEIVSICLFVQVYSVNRQRVGQPFFL